jgi:hypothetical protein
LHKNIFIKNLHTKKRENMFYKYCSPFCYTCKITIECENHILQCTSCTTRKLLRKNYLLSLQSLLEHKGTNESTIRVIIANLSSWLNNNDYASLEELELEESGQTAKAANEQILIGWDQWFYGRISQSRGEIDLSNGITSKQDPEKWGKDVITLTWEFVLDCWNIRKESEHCAQEDPQK